MAGGIVLDGLGCRYLEAELELLASQPAFPWFGQNPCERGQLLGSPVETKHDNSKSTGFSCSNPIYEGS